MMEFRPSLTRKVVGLSLLVLGVIGLVLPFLQGFVFLALGTFTLRHQYLWAHRWMGWLEGRWPDTMRKVEGMETRVLTAVQLRAAALRGGLRRLLGRA